MTRLVLVLATLVCGAALGASVAPAASPQRNNDIVGQLGTPTFVFPPTQCGQGTIFEVDFPIFSVTGDTLGTGRSCVYGWAGDPCPDFAPVGCQQETLSIFTFTFGTGSITASMTLHETFIAGGIVENAKGQITGGTGAYAGASGTVQYNGTFKFAGGVRFTLVVRLD